jgi:hypothetical protein
VSTVYLLPDDPKYPAMGFDLTISEAHEESSVTTDNPVESGVIVSDHLIHEPQRFSCNVMVSQHPLGVTFYGDGIDRPYDLPDGSAVFGFTVDREADLVTETQDMLTALRLAGATMSILTSRRTYDKMQLLHIGLPVEEGGSRAGKFQLDFKQLYIVQTQIVAAPTPKEPRGAGAVAKGAQKPDEASNPFKKLFSGDKSALASAYDYFAH